MSAALSALLILALWVCSSSHRPEIMEISIYTPSTSLPPLQFIKNMYVAGFDQPRPERCPARGKHLRLLIVVPTAPRNARRRNSVRLTWGHYARRFDIALIFLLGALPEEHRSALEQENALYRDLVIGRHVDTYWNLTLKSLTMLEWVRDYCPLAHHILKTDDDQFINVPRLLRFLEAPERINAVDTIWGRKFGVYPTEIEDVDRSDYFVTGAAYVITGDMPARLLSAAMKERFLRWEDVFLLGLIAANRLGSQTVHQPEFLFNYHPGPHERCYTAITTSSCAEMFELWCRHLQDDGCTANCTTTTTYPPEINENEEIE